MPVLVTSGDISHLPRFSHDSLYISEVVFNQLFKFSIEFYFVFKNL